MASGYAMGSAHLPRTPATYDALASDYHSLRFGERWGRYDFEETKALIKDIITTLFAGRSNWRALDLACGTGKIAVTVGQLGAKVVALDLAPNMLQQCSARSKEAGVAERLTFTNGSAEAIPFHEGSFDICFSFRFLHLLPAAAYPTFLREMARVVKPGGRIVVEIENRWYGGAIFWVKDFIRGMKGSTTSSSNMGVEQARSLAREVKGISVESIRGLLLPKGWWLARYPRLQKIARVVARKYPTFVCAHLVAIYRKDI